MREIKEKILLSIYRCFEEWSQDQPRACSKGCAACCTQNVTVTATEADMILQHISRTNQSQWLAEVLAKNRNSRKPVMTTNQFANSCLAGEETNPGILDNFSPCLFLVNGCCTIYEVRPFSCRAFISHTPCFANDAASVPENYLAAVTAVSQLIEHLAQKEYWGHLLDVLTVLSQQPTHESLSLQVDQKTVDGCLSKLLQAQPLGGFLLSDGDAVFVEPLLLSIFTTGIDHRTIEDILNGKQ